VSFWYALQLVMPKRKVFRDGEKLLMLMWVHYELFNDTFDQFKEKFNYQVSTPASTHPRIMLVEIHPGFWVEFYEIEGKMVPGFKVMLYQVVYVLPSKKLLQSILQAYLGEQALDAVASLKRRH
jgi:hypothetical protein